MNYMPKAYARSDGEVGSPGSTYSYLQDSKYIPVWYSGELTSNKCGGKQEANSTCGVGNWALSECACWY